MKATAATSIRLAKSMARKPQPGQHGTAYWRESLSNLGSSGRTLDKSSTSGKHSCSASEEELRELKMQVKELKERNAMLEFSSKHDVPLSQLFKEQALKEQHVLVDHGHPPREVYIDQPPPPSSTVRSSRSSPSSVSPTNFDIHVVPSQLEALPPKGEQAVVVEKERLLLKRNVRRQPPQQRRQVPDVFDPNEDEPYMENPCSREHRMRRAPQQQRRLRASPQPRKKQLPDENEKSANYRSFLMGEMQRLNMNPEPKPPPPSLASRHTRHDEDPRQHSREDRRTRMTRDWGDESTTTWRGGEQHRRRPAARRVVKDIQFIPDDHRRREDDDVDTQIHHHHDDQQQYPRQQHQPQYPRQQQYDRKPPPTPPPPPRNSTANLSSASEEKTIEIAPGITKVLRGADETTIAIEAGWFVVVDCFVCEADLQCVADCELVLCSRCHTISPNVGQEDDSKHGVGLGLDVTGRKKEIMAQQCT